MMTSTGFAVRHDTTCPTCGLDTRLPDSIDVTFSVAGSLLVRATQVDEEGYLEDIDGLVEAGYHSLTECGVCGERLEEYDS